MDVKDIRLDYNRVGVSVIAYTNGGDKSTDRIRGNWFSTFNNNVTRKSTNRNGYGTGITGREITDSIKRFGGAWIGNTSVAYEDKPAPPPPPPQPKPVQPPENSGGASTQENCYSYPNYFALPADIKSAIYNQFKDDKFNSEFINHITLENRRGIEAVRSYERSGSYIGDKSWSALGQIDICIRRNYQNNTLTGTDITKLVYILINHHEEYRHGGGDGSDYDIHREWTFRMDGIAKTRTELSSRTSR